MGEANLIDGKLTEAGVETCSACCRWRSGGQDGTGLVTVLLRPEQLEIEAGRRDGRRLYRDRSPTAATTATTRCCGCAPKVDPGLPVLTVRITWAPRR